MSELLNRTSPVNWLLLKSLMSIMHNAFIWIHKGDLEQDSTLHESNGAQVLAINNFKLENCSSLLYVGLSLLYLSMNLHWNI